MNTTRKNLNDITLEDAYNAYRKSSKLTFGISDYKLVKDENHYLVLQRKSGDDYLDVVVFVNSYAYIYGGDAPSRFEKNLQINFTLFRMGYNIFFDKLDVPASFLIYIMASTVVGQQLLSNPSKPFAMM